MSPTPWTLASGLDAWPDAGALDALDPQALHSLVWSGANGVPADAALQPAWDAGLLVALGDGRLGVPWQVRAIIGARHADLPPLASARLGQRATADLAAVADRLGLAPAADRSARLTAIFEILTRPRRLAEVVQRLPGETVIELLLLLDLGGRPIDPAVVGRPALRPHLERLAALGLVFVERGAWFIPMDVGLALGAWRAAYLAGRLTTSIARSDARATPAPERSSDGSPSAAATLARVRSLLAGTSATHRALIHLLGVPRTVDALLLASAIEAGVAARPLAARIFATILGRQGSRPAERVELTAATAGLAGRWLAHLLQTALESLARLAPERRHARSDAAIIIADAARWISAVRWFERVEYGIHFAATPPIASCAMLLADATQARAIDLVDALLEALGGQGLATVDAEGFTITAGLAGAFATLATEQSQ